MDLGKCYEMCVGKYCIICNSGKIASVRNWNGNIISLKYIAIYI